MAVSVTDVAALVGVSAKTVSNVVHDRPNVGAATRARVLAAMEELGYRPNLSARSLRTGRTGLITLAIPDLASPYFAELSHVIIAAAAQQDLTVLIEETKGDRDREVRALAGALPGIADGIIISPMALTPADLELVAHHKRVVLLGERNTQARVDHVAIDNEAAARDATTHLITTGRRRVAVIGYQNDPLAATSRLRYRGYQVACETHKQPIMADPVPIPLFSREHGKMAVDVLMSRQIIPDGLLCFNDELAIGAMRRIHELGWRVPEDIPVIGIDDIAEGRYSTPSLTTISPDKQILADNAIACLLETVSTSIQSPRDIIVPYRLVIRESSKRSPAR